jgi:hypothetical protein
MVLAEAAGRHFQMLWPRTPACAAGFHSIFANAWNVIDVEPNQIDRLPYYPVFLGSELPDLLVETAPHLGLAHASWLHRPTLYPAHIPLEARCTKLFQELRLVPDLSAQVEDFRSRHFRPVMVGVHVRWGDFVYRRPDAAGGSLTKVIVAVDRFLDACPSAGVFLATDDGTANPDTGRKQVTGVREQFVRRYGTRVVFTQPRSLDRRVPEAILDAAVDLWLLRSSNCFVGTYGSSFSELAVYGRAVPTVMCQAATLTYRLMEGFTRVTGLHRLIAMLGRHQFGRGDIPFSFLLVYYSRSYGPRRLAGRLLRSFAPQLYERLRARLMNV